MSPPRTFLVFFSFTVACVVAVLFLMRARGYRTTAAPPLPAEPAPLPATEAPQSPATTALAPQPPAPAPAPNPGEPKDALEYTPFSVRPGLDVLWARGGPMLKGVRDGQPVWERELNFPVADLRRGASPDELVAASVDGLSSVRLNAENGTVLKVETTTPAAGDPAAAKEGDELLAKARQARTQALLALRARNKPGFLVQVEQLRACAKRLAELGRQADAFKIWAADKKLRKALGAGAASAPTGPPAEADLEF
jgi:hypothetical protein